FTDGGAELERRENVRGPEALVRKHIRCAQLRIGLQSEARSECRVAVDAQAAGEEEPVAPPDKLLQEEAGVDDARPVITTQRNRRGGGERRVAGTRERLSGHTREVLAILEQLTAPRERRGDGSTPHRVLKRARVVERQLGVIPIRVVDRARGEI